MIQVPAGKSRVRGCKWQAVQADVLVFLQSSKIDIKLFVCLDRLHAMSRRGPGSIDAGPRPEDFGCVLSQLGRGYKAFANQQTQNYSIDF